MLVAQFSPARKEVIAGLKLKSFAQGQDKTKHRHLGLLKNSLTEIEVHVQWSVLEVLT